MFACLFYLILDTFCCRFCLLLLSYHEIMFMIWYVFLIQLRTIKRRNKDWKMTKKRYKILFCIMLYGFDSEMMNGSTTTKIQVVASIIYTINSPCMKWRTLKYRQPWIPSFLIDCAFSEWWNFDAEWCCSCWQCRCMTLHIILNKLWLN